MTNFFSKTSDTVRKVHKNFTQELTVYQFEWNESGGSNEYADGDWTHTVSTAEGTIRLPSGSQYSTDASGSDVDHDVEIWVATNEISLSVGDDDESRATELEADDGRRYKVVGFYDESSLYRVQCREVQ